MSGPPDSGLQRHSTSSPWKKPLFSSSLVSLFFVLLSQVSLAMVPRFFSSFSLLAILPLSGLMMLATLGLGRFCRRLLGIAASALACVLFNILFLWGVYLFVIREVITPLLDIVFNVECALLVVGLHRISSGDPGLVTYGYSYPEELHQSAYPEANSYTEDNPFFTRIRHCSCCKTNVRGFDHHCPAFGNCIGHKNHQLFMVLLIGFVIVEASYTLCSTQFITESLKMNKVGLKKDLSMNFAVSTMLFSLLQVLWQVVFLTWHIYCICSNIKTDEWINWKKYPEFQLAVQPRPGQAFSEIRFRNPYDKGVIGNIKDFLRSRDS